MPSFGPLSDVGRVLHADDAVGIGVNDSSCDDHGMTEIADHPSWGKYSDSWVVDLRMDDEDTDQTITILSYTECGADVPCGEWRKHCGSHDNAKIKILEASRDHEARFGLARVSSPPVVIRK